MRDYLLFAIVFGLLPFILKHPVVGVLTFTWISLMNPHRLAYGSAYDFPFAALIAGATLLSLLMTKERRSLPLTPAPIILLIFFLWTTVTSFAALEPDLAWREWNVVMKTLLIVFVAMIALNTEKDVKAFAWVVGLSLGFWALKGGIFTIRSGGTSHVLGPENSYIWDNNALALALVTILPIIWYLQLHAGNKWLRMALIGLTILCVVSAVGSYSRGALLGGGAMLFFLWLKSKQKIRIGLAVIMVVPLVYFIMPEQWFARMETINTYSEDPSAMGRINAWYFAINVAKDNFLGGGYDVFTPKMFYLYAPQPFNYHVAHSIYFQVLGDHGFVGLTLFLLLMAVTWRTGSRIKKFCKNNPELKWASDLATMCQVSIIGYAVGGAFLSLAYYDLYYDIIVLVVLLEKLLLVKSRGSDRQLASVQSSRKGKAT